MPVTKPAVILDRDGTLARIDRRMLEAAVPDWEGFHAALPFDSVVPGVLALNHVIAEDHTIIIMTGRSERSRYHMHSWLVKHDIRCDLLLMRGYNDMRADHKVKLDLYNKYVRGRFDVRLVVDDRPSVCQVWRELGLPLIQVTQPEEIPPFQNLGSDET